MAGIQFGSLIQRRELKVASTAIKDASSRSIPTTRSRWGPSQLSIIRLCPPRTTWRSPTSTGQSWSRGWMESKFIYQSNGHPFLKGQNMRAPWMKSKQGHQVQFSQTFSRSSPLQNKSSQDGRPSIQRQVLGKLVFLISYIRIIITKWFNFRITVITASSLAITATTGPWWSPDTKTKTKSHIGLKMN